MSCFGSNCTTNAVKKREITLTDIMQRYGTLDPKSQVYNVSIPEGYYVINYETFGDTFGPIIVKDPKIIDGGSDGIWLNCTTYSQNMVEQPLAGPKIETVEKKIIKKLSEYDVFTEFYKVEPTILNDIDNQSLWKDYKLKDMLGGRRRYRCTRRNQRRRRSRTRRKQ